VEQRQIACGGQRHDPGLVADRIDQLGALKDLGQAGQTAALTPSGVQDAARLKAALSLGVGEMMVESGAGRPPMTEAVPQGRMVSHTLQQAETADGTRWVGK
jgi:hypothetical protein